MYFLSQVAFLAKNNIFLIQDIFLLYDALLIMTYKFDCIFAIKKVFSNAIRLSSYNICLCKHK